MATCDFLDLEPERSPTEPHRVRCRWCGVEKILRADNPEWLKGRRFCNVVRPPDEIQAQGPLGLGDSVAQALHAAKLDRVAQFLRLCGGGCAERQAWLNKIWPYKPLPVVKVDRPQILLGFEHGFGDAVQFTAVLRHLQKHRPTWDVDVWTLPGHDGLFRGLCRRVFTTPVQGDYHQAEPIFWLEPHTCYESSPSTKVEKCLQQIFAIPPDPELAKYHVNTTEEERARAEYWLGTLGPRAKDGRFDVVAIHYQGNSSQANKNLDERTARQIVEQVQARGLTPLLLDWERRSGLLCDTSACGPAWSDGTLQNWPSGHPVWDGQASQVVALLQLCRGFIGIDSGPGHAVGATDTPAMLVWKYHHPLHYFPPMDNVVHVVRHDHAGHLRGENRDGGLRFFEDHYRSVVCLRDQLVDVPDAVAHWLSGDLAAAESIGLTRAAPFWIRNRPAEADRMIVRDVYGDDCYGVARMNRLRRVLDVGAHIGTFAGRVRESFPTAHVACVEPDPANRAVLARNVGAWAEILPYALFDRPTGYLQSSVGTGNSGASRVGVSGTAESRVEGRTLTELCEALDWQWGDLLKLDCEGAELVALADPALSRFTHVVGEVHDEPAFRAACEALPAAGPTAWFVELERHPHNPGGHPLFRLTRRTAEVN